MQLLYEHKFKQHLKRSGYKHTPERAELFRVMCSLHAPISISELADITHLQMDETTVYRNIDLFEKMGVVVRVYTGWKFKLELSEHYREHHHHMTCEKCGTLIEFEESDSLMNELRKIAELKKFIINQHTIELRGLCGSCAIQ